MRAQKTMCSYFLSYRKGRGLHSMQKELDYFMIEHSYGGNQEWFLDPMMKIGGCAAVTACDSSIYFDCYKGTEGLYPYEKTALTIQCVAYTLYDSAHGRVQCLAISTAGQHSDSFHIARLHIFNLRAMHL